jgi:DNA polymerase-1
MEKKVFLLDAFALVFRAYYALIRSPRLTSTGKNTNAQFGFTNVLIRPLLPKDIPILRIIKLIVKKLLRIF